MVNQKGKNSKFELLVLSEKKQYPSYSFGRANRWGASGLGRSNTSPDLGPGTYKAQTDFYKGQKDEVNGHFSHSVPPAWKFTESFYLPKQYYRDVGSCLARHEMDGLFRPQDGPTTSLSFRKTDMPSCWAYNTTLGSEGHEEVDPMELLSAKYCPPKYSFPKRKRVLVDIRSDTPGPGHYKDRRGAFGCI